MKKYTVLIIAIVTLGCQAIAQEANRITNFLQEVNVYKRRENLGMPGTNYMNIEGNAFFPEDFIDGRIFLNNGSVLNSSSRFNMLTENVEVRTREGKLYTIQKPELTDSVKIGDRTYVYVPEPGNPSQALYMELLYQGDYSLYVRREVEFHEAAKAEPFRNPKPARFERNKDAFFVLTPESQYEKIRSKRSLFDLFPGRKKAIKDYIKAYDLDMDEGEDLVQIIKHFTGNHT